LSRLKGCWKKYKWRLHRIIYRVKYLLENNIYINTNSIYEDGTSDDSLFQKMNLVFDYPKPFIVSKYLLSAIHPNPKVILDFMAGSGTTGHVILELNKNDNDNRRFILCTNNELNGIGSKLAKANPNENKEKFGICRRICYPRLEKIINGYITPEKEKVQGLGGNLKYYKTAFVSASLTDTNKTKLTKKATEMLCIKEDTFEKVKSTAMYKIFRNQKKYTGIIYDHLTIDNFKKEIAKVDGKFSVYVFSLGDDTFEEEFEDVKNRIKLSPIPEAILRVYRRIFK